MQLRIISINISECGDNSGKCYVGGTLNCSETYDGKKLKCNCKSNFTGTYCDSCMTGYFTTNLENPKCQGND